MPIRLEIDSSAYALLGAFDDKSVDRAETALSGLLSDLGLPGEPKVEGHLRRGARALTVRVHDRAVPFPPELLEHQWTVDPGLGVPAQTAGTHGFPDEWLGVSARRLVARHEEQLHRALGDFLVRMITSIISRSPQCLVPPSDAPGPWPPFGDPWPEDAREVARLLLAAGVTIEPCALLLHACREGQALDIEDRAELARSLLGAARPQVVELSVHGRREHLQRLINSASRSEIEPSRQVAAALGELSDRLFNNLGVVMPEPVQYVADASQLPDTVAVRVGAHVGPATRVSTISGLEAALEAELRAVPGRLITVEGVEDQLARQIEWWRTLVQATLERISVRDLTRVLRALVDEGLWILDLRGILESLLEFDGFPADLLPSVDVPVRYLDRRIPVERMEGIDRPGWREYLVYVRKRMSGHLWERSAVREGSSLRQVPPALEAKALAADRFAPLLSDGEAEDFRDLVWSASRADGVAGLVVSRGRARLPVRMLLAPEMPSFPIFSRQELPPAVAGHRLLPLSANRSRQMPTRVAVG